MSLPCSCPALARPALPLPALLCALQSEALSHSNGLLKYTNGMACNPSAVPTFRFKIEDQSASIMEVFMLMQAEGSS